jgi:hypothetical protein
MGKTNWVAADPRSSTSQGSSIGVHSMGRRTGHGKLFFFPQSEKCGLSKWRRAGATRRGALPENVWPVGSFFFGIIMLLILVAGTAATEPLDEPWWWR